MPTPSRDKTLMMDGWPGGVNNRIRETEQAVEREGEQISSSQFLRRALNVDLTAEGHPLRRRGYTLLTAGYAHSAWYSRVLRKFFAVVSGQLRVGDSAAVMSPVQNVNRYLRMSYTEQDGVVYFMNGVDSGSYSVGGWSLWPDPAQVPEQGPVSTASFEPTPGAPELPSVEHNEEGLGNQLIGDEEKYEALPIGQIVAAHKGRLYVAQDNILYVGEPMQPHYYRAAVAFHMRRDYVWMVQPVDDGLYIGDDTGVYFIGGRNPYDVQQVQVYPSGVVKFASARLPGEKFGTSFDELPVWWCRDGTMLLGLPQGQIRQLTRDRLAVPEFSSGAVALREREGISQVVSSLQKGGDENNMGATDTVVAEIRTSC